MTTIAELTEDRTVDGVFAVSESEAQAFRDAACSSVHVVSHVPATGAPAPTAGSQLLFVGNLALPTLPNVDSLQWYATEIAPRLRERLADAGIDLPVLRAAGNASPSVRESLDDPTVELLGRIDDLSHEYAAARIFVAPTRFGAGIPLKVIDAAAHGVPSVVTPLLARQLGWDDDALVVGGDDPDGFADAIATLLVDDELHATVAAAALRMVQERHSPTAFEAAVDAAMQAVLPAVHPRGAVA